mmetsp:Transcript_15845/g.24376  ORF Transcript_15845/g.24376 Transcript_15845/m.24376 type:complete len:206 (-) Transcript_15845:594-1211(-)
MFIAVLLSVSIASCAPILKALLHIHLERFQLLGKLIFAFLSRFFLTFGKRASSWLQRRSDHIVVRVLRQVRLRLVRMLSSVMLMMVCVVEGGVDNIVGVHVHKIETVQLVLDTIVAALKIKLFETQAILKVVRQNSVAFIVCCCCCACTASAAVVLRQEPFVVQIEVSAVADERLINEQVRQIIACNIIFIIMISVRRKLKLRRE